MALWSVLAARCCPAPGAAAAAGTEAAGARGRSLLRAGHLGASFRLAVGGPFPTTGMLGSRVEGGRQLGKRRRQLDRAG